MHAPAPHTIDPVRAGWMVMDDPSAFIAMMSGDKDRSSGESPSEEFKKDRKKPDEEDALDEGLDDTFPASDPVSPNRIDKSSGGKD